jgi:SPP1 gp7 family putative phage head morphogenesis protein
MAAHSAKFKDRRGDVPPLKAAFMRARKAETQFAIRLRKIAAHIDDIIRGFDPSTGDGWKEMRATLDRYAELIDPWARAVAARMISEVAARDKQTWREVSAQMGRALHQEIEYAPIGATMNSLLEEQVRLIKSMPLEAAQRVHELTIEGIQQGTRAKDITAEIMRTGNVTKSRATLIARTEVGRTATALTQARAQFVGSEGYTWATVRDSDVRPSHKAMEGKFVRWDSPPTLDNLTGHAGALPNCRCVPLVIVPN